MFGTHSVNILDARLKQDSVSARPIGKVPAELICSQTINLRREIWAMPINAAQIRQAMDALASDAPPQYSESLPAFQDGRIKQVLLPYQGGYIAAAPVLSAGVCWEISRRTFHLPRVTWAVQPNAAARSNHTELLLKQGGNLELLKTRIVPYKPTRLDFYSETVLIQFSVTAANVAGGMGAVGIPAMAAVGGLVHALERGFGAEIEFAVGYCPDFNYTLTAQKGSNIHKSAAKNDRHKLAVFTDEIKGGGQVALLLRSPKAGLTTFMKEKPFNRFAGGAVFEYKAEVCNGQEILAAFVNDDSEELKSTMETDGKDALSAALKLYQTGLHRHGDMVEYKKFSKPRSINHSGYALLERPTERPNAREGYPAAWVEPVFTAVTLSDNICWWYRQESNNLVCWRTSAEQAV